MMNPYLYAKKIFNEASKERQAIESYRLFFQALLSFLANPVVKDFLVAHRAEVPRDKKIEICIHALEEGDIRLTKLQRDFLYQFIINPDPNRLKLIYNYWLELVEDFFLEGEITIYAAAPVSQDTQNRIKNIFLKKYPNRIFTCFYHQSDREGIEASFRDAVMNLQPKNWLKTFIFSLRKGL